MQFIDRFKFKKQSESDGVKFLTRLEADKHIQETGLITVGIFDDTAGQYVGEGRRWMFFTTNVVYGKGFFPHELAVAMGTWRIPYLGRDDQVVAKDTADLIRLHSVTQVIESEQDLIDLINHQVSGLTTQHDSALLVHRP